MLVALVIVHSHNANLCYVFSEPPKFMEALPDRDIDSDVYVLVFADECVFTKEALVIAYSPNANLCYVVSEPLKFSII